MTFLPSLNQMAPRLAAILATCILMVMPHPAIAEKPNAEITDVVSTSTGILETATATI